MATDEAATETVARRASRRELAVARVVDPARERAETRVQRFLDAAFELMKGPSGKDFTVQEVVERSGQSLRSFYQYFDGKHELLLALFEDSVRSTAEQLREQVADEKTPLDRIHRFVIDYYRLCRPPAKGRAGKKPVPALAEFAQQLLTEHPHEASKAFVPLVEMFQRMLDDAAAAGEIRSGLRHRRVAGFLLQAVMFNAFVTTISGSWSRSDGSDAAEDLWDLIVHGLQADS